MASATHNLVNREGWPTGPWTDEPDRIEFEEHGFPCLIHRNRMGALCGYVAVPPGHPAHGRRYSELEVAVHGGLTYAGACKDHICHVPKPGEPDNVWWFGFDCGHAFDVSPGLLKYGLDGHDEEYRSVRYVQTECEHLARQLKDMVR